MFEHICILTEKGYMKLNEISNNSNIYLSKERFIDDFSLGLDYVKTDHLVEYPSLTIDKTNILQTDYENAIKLYKKLITVPNEVKFNPYFQVYLLHSVYYEYNCIRWDLESKSIKELDSVIKRKFLLKEHLRRHSIFGELYIVSLLFGEKDFNQLISIAVQFPDHTSQMFERSIGRNSKILANYLRVLQKVNFDKSVLNRRSNVLYLTKSVHDLAGGILIDYLSDNEVYQLILSLFENSIDELELK